MGRQVFRLCVCVVGCVCVCVRTDGRTDGGVGGGDKNKKMMMSVEFFRNPFSESMDMKHRFPKSRVRSDWASGP